MTLFVLAYFGGVLTIVSPCILPVLPFVFARSDKSFVSSGLPMLAGMAVTFAAVATLAAVGGGWAVQANEYGRIAALALLALFGLALLFPALSDRLTRPLVALGSRLSETADRSAGTGGSTVLPSLLLGVATGLLWAPCAGPVLGLILTGAALQGANVETSLLLAAYAAGAATSLALALLIGGRVFAAMKRSLGAGEWIRRGLGAAVLAGVVVIALGLDTKFLTQLSLASTAPLEQGLVDKVHPADSGQLPSGGGSVAMTGNPPAMTEGRPEAQIQQSAASGPMAMTGNPPPTMQQPQPEVQAEDFPDEGGMPSLSGAVQWLNSPPLTPEALKGKVVVVDFWTYSCINCLRSIPYIRAWAEKYKDQGLVVIGVHTPEFAFEKNVDNVSKAVTDLKISFPVAIDNDYAIWRAFKNRYWPADYFIDNQGRIRDHSFGEGDYAASEHVIQQLLTKAGEAKVSSGLVAVNASGVEAAADSDDVQSPETYIGYDRAEEFVSPGGAVKDSSHVYAAGMPKLNQWGLSGDWTIGEESAVLNREEGSIVYRFHARDLHLVLGSATNGKPVRFRVTVDGMPPGDSHGTDVDADGQGVVTGQRLYQLVRQNGTITDHTFEIRFLDPGVEAYAFTFG
jgi:cytochrome c biogenesis protein CcdA/thiol-disulfide isomerase/thioredoxin